ncbi:Hachiman antiphage defense system protein HamA [Peptostreptococcus stomatis]
MDGIVVNNIGDSIIIEIHNLSEELKEKIKEQLVEICQGEYALVSASKYCSFEETIKELVNYRLPSHKNKKIGAVGELLLNVMIREFTDMRIVSPFFNMEERNVKKGFDIISVDSKGDLWIIESKAGEKGRFDSSTKKICERIGVAKRDLDKRLNADNSQLWLNAINSVKSSLDYDSEKKSIMNILEKTSNSSISIDKNIVLGGTVFCLFDTVIDLNKIDNLNKSILKSNKFSKIRLIAIQKETFKAVIDYLHTLV